MDDLKTADQEKWEHGEGEYADPEPKKHDRKELLGDAILRDN